MKLKLTIAGKQMELTIEEARKLHAELAKVFGGSPIVIREPAPQPVFVPYQVPYQPPTFIEPHRPMWGTPEITCLNPSSAVV